jgi:D-apiose dehydrogenase
VATMLLTHKGGTASVVDCSYASKLEHELFPQTLLEVDGETGSLRLEANYKLRVTSQSGTRIEDVSPPVLPWASKPWHNIQESVALIQQHWIACLQQGKEPATSGRDNLQTFGLVEAAYESAATGKTVSLAALLA